MARVTFATASRNNSIYTVDTEQKTIEGGVFLTPQRYVGDDPAFLVGARVQLDLANGKTVITSPIKEVLGVDKTQPEAVVETELTLD